jgi:glycosyltransferase involved in cell wall biosynthesis
VLFVSKPIAPPWNDGSKNLVRDVAEHLVRARPTVLTTPSAPPLAPRVLVEPLYSGSGRFAPSVMANARVAARLAVGDPHDVWHFVFAPNPLSSSVAAVARRLRRTGGWRGKVVQTVASAPRSFDGVARFVFGDAVVALSEHTRGRLLAAGVTGRALRVIPPCARAPRVLSEEEKREVRARFELGDGPIVLYPGDYEVSQGAQTVAAAAPAILGASREATLVFACRKKTAAASGAQALVEAELERVGLRRRTRHLGEVSDMAALLAVATVVAFPVDDLYGKVDLPLVLLEAMALGVPIVVAQGGPLEALDFAPSVAPGDRAGLADRVVELLTDDAARRQLGEEGQRAYQARYTPRAVAAAYDDLYAELLGRDA